MGQLGEDGAVERDEEVACRGLLEALEGEFIFQEIREQRAIVGALLEQEAPAWPTTARAIVTGSGDSHAAAELVGRLFPGRGIVPLSAMDGSAEARRLHPGDALIGISVSGRTPRVIEAAIRARERGARVVAVTDAPGSPLTEQADETWLAGASPAAALTTTGYATEAAQGYVGYHHDVAQTKTFMAVVIRLATAAAAAGGDERQALRRFASGLDALLAPHFVRQCQQLLGPAGRLASADQAFFLGSGSALPVARFACYKMFEYNRLAHVNDIEEYCHTHYFVTRSGDAVVIIAHDGDAVARAAEIAPAICDLFRGGVLVLLPEELSRPASLDAVSLSVPCGPTEIERALALVVAIEWLTYLWGRIEAPDINTFHAGFDTERLVGASSRTIRGSRIRP